MLNSIQPLTKSRTYEILKQVQDDKPGLFTRPLELEWFSAMGFNGQENGGSFASFLSRWCRSMPPWKLDICPFGEIKIRNEESEKNVKYENI